MFPIIAVGAVILGAVVASEAGASTPKRKAPEPDRSEAQAAARPQSYVVTPLPASASARQLEPLEAVRNWIF
jgi:hypothetical protein